MSKGFQVGEGTFNFANGDKYEGYFCAHVSGLAWREGPGDYITNDGQTYTGNWKDDKLNEAENVTIHYQNRDKYYGRLQKYKYHGAGTYSFPGLGKLSSNFSNNKPVEDSIYVDYHGGLWYGRAEEERVLLSKEHVFSFELDSERGKGVPKHKSKAPVVTGEVEFNEQEDTLDLQEMEQMVFAPSYKTRSEIDFTDSEWLRDYDKFSKTHKIIMEKLKYRGPSSLSETEKVWYKGFYHSSKILQNRKDKSLKKNKNDLLKQHFEEEARNTCPPTQVFYPREQALEG